MLPVCAFSMFVFSFLFLDVKVPYILDMLLDFSYKEKLVSMW